MIVALVIKPPSKHSMVASTVEASNPKSSALTMILMLTQKTNQWNLTTRRYSEVEIEGMIRSGSTSVYALGVRDRFGDNGITGAAVVHHRGARAEIDTLLLSCRVIGRTVETALLSFLTDAARARGAKAISGWFLPTKKNAPAKDVYASHGFSREREDGAATEWTFDLSRRIPWPEWIEKGPRAAATEETKTI